MIARKLNPPKDELSVREKAVWLEFEKDYAPLVLGDSFGDEDTPALPNLYFVGWSELYPLAILILARQSGDLKVELSHLPKPGRTAWGILESQFLKCREKRLLGFRALLT